MRRIDKMIQEVQTIRKSLQPALFYVYVDMVKFWYRVECHLGYGEGKGYDTRVSFCPDMESVNSRIEEMKRQYPGNNDPVVIIDNISEGG